MKRTWLGVVVALAMATTCVEYSGAQEKQSNSAPETQKDRDPPPGAENMDTRAERAQTATPIPEGQGERRAATRAQTPANLSGGP